MAFNAKQTLLHLFLTILCEVSFLRLISWDSEDLLPSVPEQARWDFGKFEAPDLTDFISTHCPYFQDTSNVTSITTLREWADTCWRERRQLGERTLAYNPEELNQIRLCQVLLRHCRDKYHLAECPETSKRERIRLLEKCFYSFIAIKHFKPESLAEIRKEATIDSGSGLAVLVYGCRPNPFLHFIWEEYTTKSGVPFLILCPRRDDKSEYPGAELVSAGGAKLAISPVYSSATEDDRRLKLHLAEKLEAALAMLSKRSIALRLTISLFALTTVPIMTYMSISGRAPRLCGEQMVLIPFLVLVVPSFGPLYLGLILQGSAFREWRRRIIWLFPLNSLIRVSSEQFPYFVLYATYALIFPRVARKWVLWFRGWVRWGRQMRNQRVLNGPPWPQRQDHNGGEFDLELDYPAEDDGVQELHGERVDGAINELMDMLDLIRQAHHGDAW